MAAVPAALRDQLQQGRVDLDDPAVTLTLLRLNAVVGLTGFFRGHSLKSIGLQCALCHSTVDTSWRAPGIPAGSIGQRLDGWANRDLDVGAIIALAPTIAPLTDLLQIVHPAMTDDDVRDVLKKLGAREVRCATAPRWQGKEPPTNLQWGCDGYRGARCHVDPPRLRLSGGEQSYVDGCVGHGPILERPGGES